MPPPVETLLESIQEKFKSNLMELALQCLTVPIPKLGHLLKEGKESMLEASTLREPEFWWVAFYSGQRDDAESLQPLAITVVAKGSASVSGGG